MENLIHSVKAATTFDEPFSFLQFKNVFSEKLYEHMIQSLSGFSQFYELPHYDALRADGSSTRKVFELSSENIFSLSALNQTLWGEVVELLTSSAFRMTLFQQLSRGLAKRLNEPENSAKEKIAYPRLMLVKDAPGFKILPHPDIADKLVTVQFYLTKRSDLQGWGTHLYWNVKDPFFTPAYLPNSGYAFVVDSHSWHARSPIPESPYPRFTLSLTYYLDPPIPVEMEKFAL